MATVTGHVDRDVEYQEPGDRFPVSAGPELRRTGWRAGLWVRYVHLPAEGEYVVERSDGSEVAGFLIQQSETYRRGGPRSGYGNAGSPADWTNMQYRPTRTGANVVTMMSGGVRVLYRVFETIALTGGGARSGGPITWGLNDQAKVSENGLLCNDPDANLIAAGVATPRVVGIVSGVPASTNANRLSVDVKY